MQKKKKEKPTAKDKYVYCIYGIQNSVKFCKLKGYRGYNTVKVKVR